MAKKEEKTKQKSHYFRDMKAELKKVIWPTPKQLASNTLAVIAFTFIIAVIVFVLDITFDSINKYGVTPLQSKIQSSYTASKENKESSEESTENAENSENAEGEEANSEEGKSEEQNSEEQSEEKKSDEKEENKEDNKEDNKEESKTDDKSNN